MIIVQRVIYGENKKDHRKDGHSRGNFASLTRSHTVRRAAMLRIPFVSQNMIESLTRVNKKRPSQGWSFFIGAPAGTRIPDPLIKSQMLYRLSYGGVQIVLKYNNIFGTICQYFFVKNIAPSINI